MFPYDGEERVGKTLEGRAVTVGVHSRLLCCAHGDTVLYLVELELDGVAIQVEASSVREPSCISVVWDRCARARSSNPKAVHTEEVERVLIVTIEERRRVGKG